MRQPITKNPIKNTPEGTDVFNVEWVHQRLAFIIDNDEKNPWEAEEKDKSVQCKEGRELRLFTLFGWPIEPENLGKEYKWNGTIARIK